LEPPVFRRCVLAPYAPLRATCSESVPVTICHCCKTDFGRACFASVRKADWRIRVNS